MNAQIANAYDVLAISNSFLHELMHAMPMLAGAAIAIVVIVRALKSR